MTATDSVQFLALDLAKWDAAHGEALVLSLFEDERPLRGASGMADWRLCGRLSRLIRSGRLCGTSGETLLLPPARSRLAFPRVFLFGLGPAAAFDEQAYRAAVRRIREVLRRAGVRRFAMQAPGRALGRLAPRRALELWLETCVDGFAAEVTLIEPPAAQKEMAEAQKGRGRGMPGYGDGGSPTGSQPREERVVGGAVRASCPPAIAGGASSGSARRGGTGTSPPER